MSVDFYNQMYADPAPRRRGDWIQTFTGRAFYPLDPNPHDVDIVDIAHALSHVCRFGGHIKRFYSVAEHCINAHDLAVALGYPRYQGLPLCVLMHDAAEAYVGDLVRPIKRQDGLAEYRKAEEAVADAIAIRYNYHKHMLYYHMNVDCLDTVALAIEAEMLLVGGPKDGWSKKEGTIDAALTDAHARAIFDEDRGSPADVKAAFLSRFEESMSVFKGPT